MEQAKNGDQGETTITFISPSELNRDYLDATKGWPGDCIESIHRCCKKDDQFQLHPLHVRLRTHFNTLRQERLADAYRTISEKACKMDAENRQFVIDYFDSEIKPLEGPAPLEWLFALVLAYGTGIVSLYAAQNSFSFEKCSSLLIALALALIIAYTRYKYCRESRLNRYTLIRGAVQYKNGTPPPHNTARQERS